MTQPCPKVEYIEQNFKIPKLDSKQDVPRPPNVPLLRALWSLFDGIRRVLKACWGVLADSDNTIAAQLPI